MHPASRLKAASVARTLGEMGLLGHSRPVLPATADRAVVVTVTVNGTVAVPVTFTDEGEAVQVPCGIAPLHDKLTAPVILLCYKN